MYDKATAFGHPCLFPAKRGELAQVQKLLESLRSAAESPPAQHEGHGGPALAAPPDFGAPLLLPTPPPSPSPEPPFGEPRINHISTSAGRSAAQPRSPGPGSVLHRGFERLGASAASCVQRECCEHLPRRVAGRPNRLELGVQDAQLGPEATGQWEGRAGRFCHLRASALPLPPNTPSLAQDRGSTPNPTPKSYRPSPTLFFPSCLYQKSPIGEMKAPNRHLISKVVNFTLDF